jgi:hypothetical protein
LGGYIRDQICILNRKKLNVATGMSWDDFHAVKCWIYPQRMTLGAWNNDQRLVGEKEK